MGRNEEENQKKYDETTKIIDELFPKGDKRRGDAMVVAGISHMEGRAEMREVILKEVVDKLEEDEENG